MSIRLGFHLIFIDRFWRWATRFILPIKTSHIFCLGYTGWLLLQPVSLCLWYILIQGVLGHFILHLCGLVYCRLVTGGEGTDLVRKWRMILSILTEILHLMPFIWNFLVMCRRELIFGRPKLIFLKLGDILIVSIGYAIVIWRWLWISVCRARILLNFFGLSAFSTRERCRVLILNTV